MAHPVHGLERAGAAQGRGLLPPLHAGDIRPPQLIGKYFADFLH